MKMKNERKKRLHDFDDFPTLRDTIAVRLVY